MTIEIKIEAHPDRGDMGQQVERAMSALGFYRSAAVVSSVSQTATEAAYAWAEVKSEPIIATGATIPTDADLEQAALDNPNADVVPVVQKRERGKPSPGRARRTKEEIAEDEAADAADAAKQQAADEANLTDDVKPAISTGGERISPEDEQDAADEAAETEKTGLASIDVLRRLVGDYQKKHGMPAAVKLCQEGGLIGKPIHELDEAGVEAAIAAMQGAAPAKVEEPAPAEEPAALAPKTKADLVEAMMRYADKYDGTRDQAKMTHTLADMPKVFMKEFGDSVQKLSQVPEDKYAEAVAAVEAAIEADPYGRAK